jgi:hypothetical protein
MEKEILEAMKKEYKDMETIANRDHSEFKELENDPKVQRYLYLKKLMDSRTLIESGTKYIADELVDKYGSGKIRQSNNIWCYYFENEGKKLKYYIYTEKEDFTDDDIVVVYIDIENEHRTVAIKKENQEEFEKNNIVVYGNMSIQDPYDRYYNTRLQFFKECLANGQEAAVTKMLTMRKQ